MLRKTLAPFALFLLAGTAHAGDKPLYAPAPDWITAAKPIDATKLTDSDPMIVLMDNQQRLADGEVWTYSDSALRFNTPQMLTQGGTLQFPWDPAKGDIIIHQLEIIRGAEHIDLIAGGQKFSVLRREQQLEQASINGILTATLAVEGLRVGDVLHLRYSITHKDPALHGNMQTVALLMPQPAPLAYGRTRLIWPQNVDLKWRGYIPGANPKLTTMANGWHELQIDMPLPKPDDMPGDAPMRYRPLPLLEATSYADWPAVSKDMSVLFATEGTIAPNGPIAAEVAKIAKATNDPRTRAAMALQLVQDKVRYLFKGLDDGNYVPQKPENTWSLRFGDCKAKTLLLLTILRSLGIEAEPVLANIGMSDMVQIRLPAPAAFNHVIVHAKIDGKDLWLDGTGGGSRLADLDDTPAFRNVLPLRPEGAGLMAIPMHPDARPGVDATVNVDASDGIFFPASFTIKLVLRGGQAEMLRMASAQGGKEMSDKFADMLIGTYLNDAKISERTITYDEANGQTLLSAKGITSPDWSKDAGRYHLNLDRAVAEADFSPDRTRSAWKDIPVAAGDGASWHVLTKIRLPADGTGFTLDGDKTLPALLGTNAVGRSVTLADGMLTVDERSASGIREVKAADIPAVRQQVTLAKSRLLKIEAPADYPARWQQVMNGRKTKAFDNALEVYRLGIVAEPKKADPYLERAGFYQRIYDYPSAIKDMDKAIAIDPSTTNYMARGRLWLTMGDDKKAMADFQAARTADPGSTVALYQIAILKAKAGDSAGALDMVADQIAQGGDTKNDFISLQATLLGDAGRVDEGVAAMDAAIKAKPGDPQLLNSRCWLKGTRNVMLDTALKDCTKAIELADNPHAPLDSRGMVYFRMGRMEDALADFNAALDANPDSDASQFMRGVIRLRSGDTAGGMSDLAAARLMNPQVDKEYGEWGIRP